MIKLENVKSSWRSKDSDV